MLTFEEILQNPMLLQDKTPADLTDLIAQAPHYGWEVGTLRRGSQMGQGLVLREIKAGNYTGRLIQWHPGGGHHGVQAYWKVSTPSEGTVRVGPQFGDITL
jgi:hypothetical protein